MTNGTHRKTRETPVGYYVTGFILFFLAVTLAVAVSWLGSPTYASARNTSYLQPAVTAAAHLRPFWNGKSPKVWTGTVEPMCDWRYAHHIGLARDGQGNTFWLECQPEGPKGEGPWSWSLTSPPIPQRCKTPAGTLPSGDAARFGGKTYVCTDGTWVHVSRYGN
jgi:hypothetical protein